MERKFKYTEPTSDRLTFSEWAEKIVTVYGDNGKVMVAFYCAALYRSIIYKANNNYFPILFKVGQRGGGKSKAAESLASMFGDVIEDGINLESGSTTTGINRYMSSIQDGIIWLNEYKNTLPTHVIGMLKGIADGSSKITGRATQGNQTKAYKPKSSAIICGQDLPTKDPALFSRGVFCEYNPTDKKDRDSFDALKELEKAGATTQVTNEMLGYREQMLNYKSVSVTVGKEIVRKATELVGQAPQDRTAQNVYTLLSTVKILQDQARVSFPFTYQELETILLDRLKMQMQVQSLSDDVEQYFLVLQTLIGREIIEGEHFKIVYEDQGTRLYLRVKAMHNFYLQAAQRQGIVALSLSTLRSYLMQHRSFVEDRNKNVRFPNVPNPTAAMIFDYDKLINQGVEFKTATSIDDLRAAAEKKAEAQTTIHLNGNVTDVFGKWLSMLPANTVYVVDDLLEQFNQDKEPKLDRPDFINQFFEYRKVGNRNRDFSFNSNTCERVKLINFEPF